MAGRKRTAAERDAPPAGALLRTIVGARRTGHELMDRIRGPRHAPLEETGLTLSGALRGAYIDADGRLAVLLERAEAFTLFTVDLAPPYKRCVEVVRAPTKYSAVLARAGPTMLYTDDISRGSAVERLDGAKRWLRRPLAVLMTVATPDAAYLVGVPQTAHDVAPADFGRLCVARVEAHADAIDEWMHGDAPAPWAAALADLLGPAAVLATYPDVYAALGRVFHAAHQRAACFAGADAIGLHLNAMPRAYARDGVEVRLGGETKTWQLDELQSLPLAHVHCGLMEGASDWDPLHRWMGMCVKGNTGLHMDAGGRLYWVEQHCVRCYSGYYAPLGTADGATELPPLRDR